MDLQHPDITRILRTGYPYKEKETQGNGSHKNNTGVNYNTLEENLKMNIVESINKINEQFEFLEGNGTITLGYSLGYKEKTLEIHIDEIDNFLKLTEGYPVEITKYRDSEYQRAEAIINKSHVFMLVDKKEEKELRELLNNE